MQNGAIECNLESIYHKLHSVVLPTFASSHTHTLSLNLLLSIFLSPTPLPPPFFNLYPWTKTLNTPLPTLAPFMLWHLHTEHWLQWTILGYAKLIAAEGDKLSPVQVFCRKCDRPVCRGCHSSCENSIISFISISCPSVLVHIGNALFILIYDSHSSIHYYYFPFSA